MRTDEEIEDLLFSFGHTKELDAVTLNSVGVIYSEIVAS